MMSLDRRSFLRGVLGNSVAGGVIVSATDAEIAAFGVAPDAPVTLAQRLPNPTLSGYLYDQNGQRLAIITGVNVFGHGRADISLAAYGHPDQSLIELIAHTELVATLLPGATLDSFNTPTGLPPFRLRRHDFNP